jgi:hypothetical protein
MTNNQILQELEALAERLCIPLDYEEADIRGGLCRVAGQPRIIIGKGLSPSEKINLLCQALRQLPIENVFVLPQIRVLLETSERSEALS